MNVLTRYSAKCLWTGAAVRLPRQPDGRVLTASSARFLCAAAGPAKDLGEMVKKDKVVVFMKGTPAQPLCGFSNAVVQILRMHGVDDYAAYNVLDDSELREAGGRLGFGNSLHEGHQFLHQQPADTNTNDTTSNYRPSPFVPLSVF
uniref:Glutaredoxin 5 homolog (S. cerevisiae) n=1 Tax=Gasterosteus aculeatus aculeatus TaxID=481459 RepID=A0AAQ4S635_GASAC